MGAGDYPPNGSPAGHDPLQLLGVPEARGRPAAIFFDGATMDYPLDADGKYIPCHPVDQRVALKMLHIEGSMAAVPEHGSRLRKLPRGNQATNKLNATDAVEKKLAKDVEAGDIEILEIETESNARGQISVAVHYVNLRISPRIVRTARSR